MKQEIRIPEVAEGVTTGTVVAIAVTVGDQVETDQTLLELETDKSVVEIPSPTSGKVSEILVEEGAQVDVGAVVILIESESEASDEPESEAPDEPESEAPDEPESETSDEPESETSDEPESEVPDEPERETSDESEPEVENVTKDTDRQIDLTSVRRDDRVAPAAPSVRRLARELGVDIYQVQGSGPAGRISADDVRKYVRSTMKRVTSGEMIVAEIPGLHAQRPLPDFSRFGEISREPLSKVRELTADAMSYAWSTIPMVTQYDKAYIGKTENFRKEFNTTATPETKLTMTAFLVKVCAVALRAFPHFNSALDLASRELILNHFINIGVAVDTPAGLLVPVIRKADDKGVEKIATELHELAERTRERRIKPAELEGGTFTISNLGGIGGSSFTPIVYAPQVAILGVSEAENQPVWNGSEFEPKLMLPLSLTYDHRVIDGAAGARFLRWICQALENPLNLVMKG
ncbi:MAG TPA: 2-oxo acid dehydrogenase subunit E2 [Geopsychrobacteraceae bacterium]|nr:2-oxo acid dehydrogenase subunit E2 [Geopsychrobacteraceae bacterium]